MYTCIDIFFYDYFLVLELSMFYVFLIFLCFHAPSLDLAYGTVMLMVKSSLKDIQRTVMLTVKLSLEDIH